MYSNTIYIFVGIYFVLLLIWCLAAFFGHNKYRELIDALPEEGYSLRELYSVGFSILGWIKYTYSSPIDRKRIAQCKIAYGQNFGLYNYTINLAEKVTYSFTIAMLGFILYPVTGEIVALVACLVAAVISYWFTDMKITDIITEREDALAKTFPDMLSKMALLINAGMIMKEAWETVAQDGEGILFDEMRLTIEEINNGVPELDAYINFGNRCGVTYIKKFTAQLAQNLTKGNSELVRFLRETTLNSWEEKKHLVKRMGEKASSKLMIPIGMILIGILIMVLVPVVSELGI